MSIGLSGRAYYLSEDDLGYFYEYEVVNLNLRYRYDDIIKRGIVYFKKGGGFELVEPQVIGKELEESDELGSYGKYDECLLLERFDTRNLGVSKLVFVV